MPAGPHYAEAVRAYALVELGDSESIDLFLREEDARLALETDLIELQAMAAALLETLRDVQRLRG